MNAQLFFCKGGCFSLLYFVCPFLQFDFFRVGLKNEIANQNNKNKNNPASNKSKTMRFNRINNDRAKPQTSNYCNGNKATYAATSVIIIFLRTKAMTARLFNAIKSR